MKIFQSDLPDMFQPMQLTPQERKRLEAWAKRENWTRVRSIIKDFGPLAQEGYGDRMPVNLIAPGVKGSWSEAGKHVCVMCGYVTSVTNICRNCKELPTETEMIGPTICYTHGEMCHYIVKDRKIVWVTHDSIGMVKVS